MSDRPTLWVFEVLDGEHDGVIYVNYTMPREATRADLLAALPDKYWFCLSDGHGHVDRRCAPDSPHDGCHWAVKP